MRRKVDSKGRTTLYVTDKDIWERAKKEATKQKYASVSEYIFKLLKKEAESYERQEEQKYLSALEKYYELDHWTLGILAEACDLTRPEAIERMKKYNFSVEKSDLGHTRDRIHELLSIKGIEPFEAQIYSQIARSNKTGLALLPLFFSEPQEFCNELAFHYALLLSQVQEEIEFRKSLDEFIEKYDIPKSEWILNRLSINKNSISPEGPTDWYSPLLYLASVGLFHKQTSLLCGYFIGSNNHQQKLFRNLNSVFFEAMKEWHECYNTNFFQNLWQIARQVSHHITSHPLYDIEIPHSKSNVRLSLPPYPSKGRKEVSKNLCDLNKNYYLEEIDNALPVPQAKQARKVVEPPLLSFDEIVKEIRDKNAKFYLRIIDETFGEVYKKGSLVPDSRFIERNYMEVYVNG